MAKKDPETIDRYQIVAECSMEQMGFVLAALTNMGLQNIGYKLITDVLRYKDRKAHEVTATDFATEYVKAHPRFKSAELVAHFKAAGREDGSAYYAIKKLIEANLVRKNADDELIRVEALPAPEPKEKRHYEVANKDLIANAIQGRKQFTVAELRALFTKEGRPEKSISPILTKMAHSKQIQLTGSGQYVVLAKGGKPKPKAVKKKAAAAATAPASNGAMTNGSGEAAHG
jgi:hypothetical protein